MSKACASRAEAEATVAHYAEKDQPAQIEEKDGTGNEHVKVDGKGDAKDKTDKKEKKEKK